MNETKRFRTICADPPWPYPDGFASYHGNPKSGYRRVEKRLPYEGMSVDDICALPIRSVATHPEGCNLFLWTTNRYLAEGFDVLNAWGFTYRQTLVWHKTGNPSPFGGVAAPHHAEFLLLGQWGPTKMTGRLKGSVIAAPAVVRGHSQKPDLFLDLIEQISPGPYLELFARRARFGWEYAGNESLGTVKVEGLAA